MAKSSKICRLCGEEKPISRYSWRSDSGKYRTECKDCLNMIRRSSPSYQQWHKNNPDRVRKLNKKHGLRRTCGISLELYELTKESQGNKCAICGNEETSFNKKLGKVMDLHADHDHVTGEFRELLCSNCNRGLGCFKDNVDFLKSAINYIVKHTKE